MPLSEDEQRILRQIEQELEQDPTFSQRGYRVSRRRSLMLVAGLVIGFVITIGGLLQLAEHLDLTVEVAGA